MQLSLRAAPSTPRRTARPVVAQAQAQGAGASADSAGAATAALGRREAATLAALALACSSEPAYALQRIGRGGSKSKDVPIEDYTTLSSGLKVYDVTTGSGQVAKLGDRVVIHYDCRIAGKKLTISSSRVGAGVTGGVPYGWDLGTKGGTSGGPFVQGINEAVLGMRVGGQRRAIVPPALAYGELQVQEIAPNSTLQFDIELLSIKGDLPKATLF